MMQHFQSQTTCMIIKYLFNFALNSRVQAKNGVYYRACLKSVFNYRLIIFSKPYTIEYQTIQDLIPL